MFEPFENIDAQQLIKFVMKIPEWKTVRDGKCFFIILRMESYREDCAPSNPEFTVKVVWGEVKDAKHFNHLRMDGVF